MVCKIREWCPIDEPQANLNLKTTKQPLETLSVDHVPLFAKCTNNSPSCFIKFSGFIPEIVQREIYILIINYIRYANFSIYFLPLMSEKNSGSNLGAFNFYYWDIWSISWLPDASELPCTATVESSLVH